MKKLIVEDANEGLLKLLGEKITVFCINYFYTGELVGVSDDSILLKDPAIVYETGSFDKPEWGDCQSLNVREWFIQKNAIESFGILK